MPTYALVTERGEEVDVTMSMQEYDAAHIDSETVLLPDGRKAKVDMQRQWSKQAQISKELWANHKSEALAVHPSQAAEATQVCAQSGVPTEHDAMGYPVFRSREHYKRYCRLFGYHNRDETWSGRR